MLELRVFDGVSRVDAAHWDALVGDGSPFMEHTFLAALEATGCVGGDTGWTPIPITAWRDGRLVGAVAAYVKGHSFGEFVYDWQIAEWARRRGLRYYPKIVVCAPYSPVTGERLLVHPEEAAPDTVRDALLQGLVRVAEQGISGINVLFPNERDGLACGARGGAERLQWQYHWVNKGFDSFDDFLATLPSKRRSEVRRERRQIRDVRVEAAVGDRPGLAGDLADFYAATYARHTGGEGYLNGAFFEELCARWGDRVHTVSAFVDGRRVAGTFNVWKGDRLYGRYWGARVDIPYLHFEVAIYAAVDWCIANGVSVFEPGHGGEHKRARGFAPTLVRSAHWMTDPRLDAPIRRFYQEEAAAVRAAVDAGE